MVEWGSPHHLMLIVASPIVGYLWSDVAVAVPYGHNIVIASMAMLIMIATEDTTMATSDIAIVFPSSVISLLPIRTDDELDHLHRILRTRHHRTLAVPELFKGRLLRSQLALGHLHLEQDIQPLYANQEVWTALADRGQG